MFQISYLSPKNESQKILRQEAISADNLTFKEAYALFKKINQGNYPEECKILVRWYKKMTGDLIHSNQHCGGGCKMGRYHSDIMLALFS